MQAWYPATFERDMGFTAADFVSCLPEAFRPAVVAPVVAPDTAPDKASGTLSVQLESGVAHLRWHALAPRVIALMRLPRLHVHFDFSAIADDERQRVLARFDLGMLRGGG